MTATLDLLTAIERDPADDLAWLALADCLEEVGEERRADLVRLREWLRVAELDHPERRGKERRLQALIAEGVRPAVPTLTLHLPHDARLTLALIPPGAFWMGSPEEEPNRYGDEVPSHLVRLSRGFWAGVCPVKQAQWHAVTGVRAAHYSGEERPVDQASWRDCQRFGERLAELIGRKVRMPTEAEWEYCCRAGTTTRYYSGDDEQALAAAAWYQQNSNGEPRPVGKKLPNAWGLHDVLGGVWEWCADSQRDFGKGGPVTDPVGEEGGLRVVRGGSIRNDPRAVRCAHRGIDSLDSHLGPLGCRVVVELS